eukprot:COSAG01_NODE_40307_length_465_cov_0.986339_1_plen_30_part_10
MFTIITASPTHNLIAQFRFHAFKTEVKWNF